MTDFVILVLAIICIGIFVKSIVRDVTLPTNKNCSGGCGGCRFRSRCKDLEK